MATPDTYSTEGNRGNAGLPNPFLFSENSGNPPSQTNDTNVDAPEHLIDNYPLPNFGGSFVPEPVPILDFDGEPEKSPPSEAPYTRPETEKEAALSYSSGTPLRGIKLFSAVFAELSHQLGKEFSTA